MNIYFTTYSLFITGLTNYLKKIIFSKLDSAFICIVVV